MRSFPFTVNTPVVPIHVARNVNGSGPPPPEQYSGVLEIAGPGLAGADGQRDAAAGPGAVTVTVAAPG
jgi:hypothetical protein